MCNIWPTEREEEGAALATLINASTGVNWDAANTSGSRAFKGTNYE